MSGLVEPKFQCDCSSPFQINVWRKGKLLDWWGEKHLPFEGVLGQVDRHVHFCIFPFECLLKIAGLNATWSSAIRKITRLSNLSYTGVIWTFQSDIIRGKCSVIWWTIAQNTVILNAPCSFWDLTTPWLCSSLCINLICTMFTPKRFFPWANWNQIRDILGSASKHS